MRAFARLLLSYLVGILALSRPALGQRPPTRAATATRFGSFSTRSGY